MRATFTEGGDNNDEAIPVIYKNYYPFGWEVPGAEKPEDDFYRFAYQGQFAEKDQETGFTHFEARLFDTRIGRWMVPDPAGQHWSPYTGMGNNPRNRIDPNGEWDFLQKVGNWFSGNGFMTNAEKENFWLDNSNNIKAFEISEITISGNKIETGRRSWRMRNRRRLVNGSSFDERGRELLGRWLNGSGSPLISHNGYWGDYMKNNRLLSAQIEAILRHDAKSRSSSGPINISSRPEIENGYHTGYEMLHGPHKFTLTGQATVLDNGRVVYSYTATWVDVIDPNPIYPSDSFLSNALHQVYSPADYSVTISWDNNNTVK